MLKLNASYSKKVPADGEYTSQSYHASIEVELPDGLSSEQLNGKIHETFAMVRASVEAELHQNHPRQNVNNPVINHSNNRSQDTTPASSKQIKFMLDLARGKGINPAQIAAQHGVASVELLTKAQCSAIINNWKAA